MTTTTRTQPVVDGLADVDKPRCEALHQCVKRCCDPARCERPAVARVSFGCDSPGCDRARHVMLLCAVCADESQAAVPSPTRRPL